MLKLKNSCTRKYLLLIGLMICTHTNMLLSQDYEWPTNASKVITSSFAEYRSGHFHAGIDFKTWGQVGYKAIAIESGSIVRVRTSPYGYGRAVYLQLDNGLTAVYAHLQGFSDRIESIIKNEQQHQGRYTIDKHFVPGVLPVERGQEIGTTGRTGTRDPHLHFEVRDSVGRPINPLALAFAVEDRIPPVITSMAVTPRGGASSVNGDFIPQVFRFRKTGRGTYHLDEVIEGWGELAFASAIFDQANGARNRFAPYRVRWFVDDSLLFTVQFDRFAYSQTGLVDLDRDFRLKVWGYGTFQNLYRNEFANLPFYNPNQSGAGIIKTHSWSDPPLGSALPSSTFHATIFSEGDHDIRIEAFDFAGNRSVATGILRVLPVVKQFETGSNSRSPVHNSQLNGQKEPEIETTFFEDYVRFKITFPDFHPKTPTLIVGLNQWNRQPVTLFQKLPGIYVGAHPTDHRWTGVMTTELMYADSTGEEHFLSVDKEVYAITPASGGSLLSPDKNCLVVFPKGSVYKTLVATCAEESVSHPMAAINSSYRFFPNDVRFRRSVRIMIDARDYIGDSSKLGIYRINGSGKASFVGNGWNDGMVTATTSGFSRFTVLEDTVAPEIHHIEPMDSVRLKNTQPKISVVFKDTLSGISGEDAYIVRLNGKRLIIEYDPVYHTGFHQVLNPLSVGEHKLDVVIKDRAGNVAQRKSMFTVEPQG